MKYSTLAFRYAAVCSSEGRNVAVAVPGAKSRNMKRRILILNERDLANPLAGGAEVHTFEVFKRLAARGHQVSLLAAGFSGAAAEETLDGIKVRRLGNRYSYYAIISAAARRCARDHDIAVDVLCKLPFLSPWLLELPCLAIVHHLFGATAFRQVSPPIAAATWLAEKLIPPAYRESVTLAVSPSTKQDLVARGMKPERIWIVPNGLDHSVYKRSESAEVEPLLVWLGRLEPYKRADLMIEAMVEVRRHVPEARLIVAGSGTARPSLEALVHDLGLDDTVKFAGFVPETDKAALLERAAALVQTSEKEGWGITVLEGNACGTPTIASKVPGLRDSVVDGETGVLFDYGYQAQLAAAAVKVLADAEFRERLSANALAWAARFSWERVADDTEKLIEEAICPGSGELDLLASPFTV